MFSFNFKNACESKVVSFSIETTKYHYYPEKKTKVPDELMFDVINPAKIKIQVKGAVKPFYVNFEESYTDKWKLLDSNKKTMWATSFFPFLNDTDYAGVEHFKLDGLYNGWYIDPNEFCSTDISFCQKDSEGKYSMDIFISYEPQGYLNLGIIISATTIITVGAGYYISAKRKHSERDSKIG